MKDVVREEMDRFQALILARYPDTRFKLEPTEKEDIWHFSIFSSEGHIQMPPEITQGLNQIWREHKLSIITTVYPISLYGEES